MIEDPISGINNPGSGISYMVEDPGSIGHGRCAGTPTKRTAKRSKVSLDSLWHIFASLCGYFGHQRVALEAFWHVKNIYLPNGC